MQERIYLKDFAEGKGTDTGDIWNRMRGRGEGPGQRHRSPGAQRPAQRWLDRWQRAGPENAVSLCTEAESSGDIKKHPLKDFRTA